MRARDELSLFVRDALVAGRERGEIRAAILAAGWREKDAARALGGFADTGFLPPVPRPQGFVSARDAVVYGLGFFSLVVVVGCFVAILFDAVDALAGEGPLDLSDMAWRIAALVVFAPIFAATDWRADRDSPVRKVCAYAALFVSALGILFTLVSVIAIALSGGLTVAFVLKAAALAATAAAIMLYYRKDFLADRETA